MPHSINFHSSSMCLFEWFAFCFSSLETTSSITHPSIDGFIITLRLHFVSLSHIFSLLRAWVRNTLFFVAAAAVDAICSFCVSIYFTVVICSMAIKENLRARYYVAWWRYSIEHACALKLHPSQMFNTTKFADESHGIPSISLSLSECIYMDMCPWYFHRKYIAKNVWVCESESKWCQITCQQHSSWGPLLCTKVKT